MGDRRAASAALLATAAVAGCGGAETIDAGDWSPSSYVDCPTWAPDGSSFAFARHGSIGRTPRDGVFMFDTKTRKLHRVSRVAADVVAWPRQNELIVLRPAKGRAELRVLNVRTGSSRRLRVLPFAPDFTPVASRDAHVLAYEARGAVWAASASGRRVRKISRASDDFAVSPTVSPNGRLVAYSTLDGLQLVDVADGTRRPLWTRGAEAPVFSPDGRAIAFSSTGSGLTSDVFVVEIRSGLSHQLTRWSDTEDAPASWTVDGSQVLVESGGGLAVAATDDGRELARLPDFGGAWPGTGAACPSASVDGRTIAFVRSWPSGLSPPRSAVYVAPASLDDATSIR